MLEMIAVIIIIVILAAFLLPTLFNGRDQAVSVRCKDEAAALNTAETAYQTYMSTTAVAMGTTNLYSNPSLSGASRIASFKSWGFIESTIDPTDVNFDSTKLLWSPAK